MLYISATNSTDSTRVILSISQYPASFTASLTLEQAEELMREVSRVVKMINEQEASNGKYLSKSE